MNNNN